MSTQNMYFLTTYLDLNDVQTDISDEFNIDFAEYLQLICSEYMHWV